MQHHPHLGAHKVACLCIQQDLVPSSEEGAVNTQLRYGGNLKKLPLPDHHGPAQVHMQGLNRPIQSAAESTAGSGCDLLHRHTCMQVAQHTAIAKAPSVHTCCPQHVSLVHFLAHGPGPIHCHV